MTSLYKIFDLEFSAAYTAWKAKRQQTKAVAEASASDQVNKISIVFNY